MTEPIKKNADQKPTRVGFGPDVKAEDVLKGIKAEQDAWAKRNPAVAHEKYPKVFDAQGNRISQ